jgi:hypothetical protein
VRSKEDNCAPRKLWVSFFNHKLPHCHSHPPHCHPSFAVICDDCFCTCSISAAGAVSDSHYALYVKASAKTLSSYFVVFAYIAYNLAQS